MFISGMITSKISKTISIMGAPCNSSNYITLIISNDGTEVIKENEIKIYNGSVYVGTFNKTIQPKESNMSMIQGAPGSNPVRAVSPSNSVDFPVWF
jgi:hypothetical protein